MRYPTWGDALGGAETRTVTSYTLGVRVVGVLESLVVAVAAHAPRGWHPAGALGHRPDVRALTRRDALRAARTHPITPDMLGARVVGVLGSLIVAVGSQGVAPSGQCRLNRSMWAPRPSSALGWLS